LDNGFVVWLTGLPASGKTTIANRLATALRSRGMRVEVLDGEEVRRTLSKGLGFSREDREENVRRVAFVSKLLARNGVAVVVALISPYRGIREEARKEIENFMEVWVNCPLEACMRRDPKGLYKRALAGQMTGLTGLQDVYEEPIHPEVVVNTDVESVEECTEKIVNKLRALGWCK